MWVYAELDRSVRLSVCPRDVMAFFPVSGAGGDGEEVDVQTFVIQHD